MGEIGKLLENDLRDIPKKYPHASGKRKLKPAYYLWVIGPFIVFIIWSQIVTQGPQGSKKTDNGEQEKQIADIVQSTNARMTEVSVMEALVKQLTPDNVIKSGITETPQPSITPTIQGIKNDQNYVPQNDPLATGLDPNEVMQVLQNLPQPGRYRVDSQNEAVVQTRDFKISMYFPPYGGINCGGRYMCNYTASGKRALTGVGYFAACPPSLEFGTKLIIFNKEWVCEDRGSAITEEWLDLEYPYMPYGLYWSQLVTVKIIGRINEYATITITPIPEYPTITKTPPGEAYPTITKTPIEIIAPTKTPTPIETKTASPTVSNTPTNTPGQFTSTPAESVIP